MRLLKYKVQLILTFAILSETMALSEDRASVFSKHKDFSDYGSILVADLFQSVAMMDTKILTTDSIQDPDKEIDAASKESGHLIEILLSAGFFSLTCLAIFLFVGHKKRAISMHITYKSPIHSSKVEIPIVQNKPLFFQENFEINSDKLNDLITELERKKMLLSDMKELIESTSAKHTFDFKTKTSFQRILRNIHYANHADQEWEHFRSYFGKTNDVFLSNLRSKFPSLSHNDYKLCILYRMNTEHGKIASIMEISSESVRVMRHRLKKKLNMPSEVSLSDFLTQFDDAVESNETDDLLRAS